MKKILMLIILVMPLNMQTSEKVKYEPRLKVEQKLDIFNEDIQDLIHQLENE